VAVGILIAALAMLGGCVAGGGSLCEAAGGRYEAGTCARSSPELQAAQDRCQASGGVYLGGQDRCAVGANGGP
jgi:hypothetical protein